MTLEKLGKSRIARSERLWSSLRTGFGVPFDFYPHKTSSADTDMPGRGRAAKKIHVRAGREPWRGSKTVLEVLTTEQDVYLPGLLPQLCKSGSVSSGVFIQLVDGGYG